MDALESSGYSRLLHVLFPRPAPTEKDNPGPARHGDAKAAGSSERVAVPRKTALGMSTCPTGQLV